MSRQPDWQRYQSDVADFLSQLGFTTRTDERIRGARAEHDIDVTARMEVAGVEQLWVIECKKWKRPVPKERALTFLEIVGDIGADRGLLFAENGFQVGAIRATENTNVTLTSLSVFKEGSANEVASTRAKVLDEKIAALHHKFMSIWDLSEEERDARCNSQKTQ